MKPKNKIQSRLVELSGQLSPLTTPQMEWAFRNTHEHFAYRLKGGKCTCMDCGAEFIETRDGRCFCPECGAQLEIKDTKERLIKQKSYFVVITTKEEYQVVRMWMLLSEMRKGAKAKPAYLEIGQYWIDPQGRKIVIGLQRTLGGYYFDTFAFCSPFEIRRDNEAFWRIADEWVYPRIKVTDTIKRNGFKNSTYHIHPVTLFQQLLSNPKAETLMNSKDVGMWFDYIKMLERMGRDINSPSLIAPQDLKNAHDIYVAKVNRQRIKEQREKERQQAIEDKAKFEELKSRYFGMAMTDGEIEISLEDYHIIQCRAFANGICEYTEQIAGIINANKKMIAERKRA